MRKTTRGALAGGVAGLALLAAGVLTGPAPADAASEYRWRQNVLWGPADIKTRFQKEFADLVAERTKGAVKITQFPGSTLMKATDAAKETSRGTLKLDGNASMFYEPIVPFFKLFTLPFYDLSGTDFRELLKPGTRGRQTVDEILTPYNLKLLAVWEGGTSGLVAYESLPTVESLRGKKLRVATEVSGNVLRAAGGQVISMSGAEAPDAMRRRIIDASAIEPTGIKSRGYHDFAKYWMDWDIVPITAMIMMNLDEWKRLAKELQDVIWATAREVEERADKAMLESQAAALAEVTTKHGMTVVRIDASEKDRLRTLGQSVINDAIGKLTPPAHVQEFVKLMDEARAKRRK